MKFFIEMAFDWDIIWILRYNYVTCSGYYNVSIGIVSWDIKIAMVYEVEWSQ